MELKEAWRDVIRPTMRREPKTPGNKGVEVVMVDLNGDGIPDPPAPEREPIAVVHATAWAHHNNYVKGQTVYCNVAAFSGGSAETIYRWRLQKRADADSDWLNYSWTSYSDHALEVNVTCPEGQMRIHCQARDDSVDPVDQVNSFSTIETVTTPTLLPLEITANGLPYDPSNETLDGTAGESVLLVAAAAAHDLLSLSYSWSVRSGSARLTPNGPSCTVILQSTETELVSIQADIVDFTEACPDTPQSVRFNIMTRPAQRVESAEPTWNPLYEPLGDELELALAERHVIDQEIESNYAVTYEWEVHDPYGVNTEPGEHGIAINLANMQRLYPEMNWVEAQSAGPQLVLHCMNPPEGDVVNRIHIRFTAQVKHPMVAEPPHRYSYTKFIFA